ncbi:MAG: hypothetical protein IJS71_08280 [Clostridia bacterium]|nr:hypothetical protein [Clostridia bacterium]
MAQAQDEPKTVEISGNVFHIFPFPAMKAANISGELFALIGPALGGLSAAVTTKDGEINTDKLTGFFASLTGDRVEGLLRRLLVANKNISVEVDGASPVWLTGDVADKIFCGAIGAMYRLAVEVIKVNYGDFFGVLGGLFGSPDENLLSKISKSTETST